MRATLIFLPLLAACIPVEVRRAPDGSFAYRVDDAIAVVRPDAHAPKFLRTVLENDERLEPVWLDWTPDGRRVVFTCGRKGNRWSLCALDVATGRVRVLVTQPETTSPWFPRVSPDGRSVSYAVGEDRNDAMRTELRLVSLQTGAERVLAKRSGLLHAWSPDGRTIAIVRAGAEWTSTKKFTKGELALVDVATGRTRALAPAVYSGFSHLRFSPDGKRIVYCAAERTGDAEGIPSALFAWDLGRKRVGRLSREGENVAYSAASPSGGRMFYVAAPKDKALEGDIVVVDERGRRTKVGTNHGNLFPFWLDDERIAFATKGKDKRLVAADRHGKTTDVTKRFFGMEIKG